MQIVLKRISKILCRYCYIKEQSKHLFHFFLHLTYGDDLFSDLIFKYICIWHEKAIVTSLH